MAKQQTSPNNRRGDMIYCERCGEDYSATYRRCPFCDERPGRRIDDYGAARSPLRLVVLIGSLVLILAAAFIVFSKVEVFANTSCKFTNTTIYRCHRARKHRMLIVIIENYQQNRYQF